MKKYLKLITVFCGMILFLNSCNIDDYTPTGQVTDKTIITNEKSARIFLNGIYNRTLPTVGEVGHLTEGLCAAGIESNYGANVMFDLINFTTNKVEVPRGKGGKDQALYRFYHASYKTINSLNIFIPKLEKGIKGISEKTKNTMLSEAKTLRANTHFMLLRVFGQFYDINSKYGIVASSQFIDGSKQVKRNTVAEVYDLIISDLQFSVKYGTNGTPVKNTNSEEEPVKTPNIYVSKTFSKALLAKVYLYKGGAENYQKTVSLCESIINNLGGQFSLEQDYASIFEKGFSSSEIIFAPSVKTGNIYGNPFFRIQGNPPATYLKKVADEEYGDLGDGSNDYREGYDPRFSFTFGGSTEKEDGRYNKHAIPNATFYYLRVAEVYLMYAEAIARTNGDEQKAINALNTVRKRAFAKESYVDDFLKVYEPYDKATFLEDVRKEKLLELHLENAEPWFDLVRYSTLGDITIKDIKSSIDSKNQLIFPVPSHAILNNPAFGEQNPGYN